MEVKGSDKHTTLVFTSKYQTSLEVAGSDKRTSLTQFGIYHDCKEIYSGGPVLALVLNSRKRENGILQKRTFNFKNKKSVNKK